MKRIPVAIFTVWSWVFWVPAAAQIPQAPPLIDAALAGRLEAVKALLDKGADVNTKTPDEGATALMAAVAGGHEAVARLLIERRADLNARTSDGTTALFIAAASGSESMVALLLKAGADPSLKDSQGADAGHYAMLSGQHRIMQMLRAPAGSPTSRGELPPPRARVTPVAGQALADLLPTVTGWTRADVKHERNDWRGYAVSEASATYRRDASEIEIKISDAGYDPQDRALLLATLEFASPESTAKPDDPAVRITISGQQGFRLAGNGLVILDVAERFTVTASASDDAARAELRRALEAIDFARLAALARTER